MKRGRPFRTELTPAEYRRLMEVATRRVAGQTWTQIAQGMGWRSKQAAQAWTARANAIADKAEQAA